MTNEIDAINAKILKELLMDGRKSFAEIAKECNTSRDVIAKRYKQMVNKGIIVGSTIQNSPACYGGNLVAAIEIDVQPHKEEEVLLLAHKIPQVIQGFRLGFSPSLSILVVLKNIEELEGIKQSIKGLPFLLRVEVGIWIGIRTIPENLSILNVQEPRINIETEDKSSSQKKVEIKLDAIDTAVIEKLAADGRTRFEKIAKELKVSTDTIIRRYERLKRNGDLKVVIQLNLTKIGYPAFAMFSVTSSSQENLAESIRTLAKIPDINFIIKNSGSFDYLISLIVRDIQQLTAVQEEIANMPGVINMKTVVGKMFMVWPIPREFISSF
jgi:DNA-binding Lrp family transcriptional regulator